MGTIGGSGRVTLTEELVRVRPDGPLARIVLDSPENRNALSGQLVGQLLAALRGTLESRAVRVVVLTHTGNTFCSGADLRQQEAEFLATGRSPGAGGLVPLLELIMDHPKPVVCEVAGAVRGGGMGILAASDLVVAGDSANFAFSEVRVGVAPAVISVAVLRRVGRPAALELMLTGRTFSAPEALRVGLVTRVVPDPQLASATQEICSELLKAAPGAQAETKRLIAEVPKTERGAAFAKMSELSTRMFSSPEGQEGISAFLERRRPSWLVQRDAERP